jgi:hypothetical protein
MTALVRLGPDIALNRALRPDDPQFGAAVVEGYPGSTPCAHVLVPFKHIADWEDIGRRYPHDAAGLEKMAAAERAYGPMARGMNDNAFRISAMIAVLRAGGKLPPVVGEFTADGLVRVWDGYHRVAAIAVTGGSTVAAYVAPRRR